MVQEDENRFSIAVRGGDGELLFSSDSIDSLEFVLSENELRAKVDLKRTDRPVIVNEDGDQSESRE